MKIISLLRTTALPVVFLTTACHSEANFSSGMKKSYDAEASQVFSFTASSIVPGSVTIKDGGRYTAFDVTQAEKNPSQVIQRQIKRKSYSEPFVQGHNAKFTKEEFQLSEAGLLDLLIVVDDSRSMSEEQAMIGKGLAPLISEIKDSNWQIAVISMSDPCVSASNLIKKTDADPSSKFAAAVKKPYDRLAMEQGFPMAIQSLKGQCNGSIRSWLRAGSSLGILFLSDENNCGSNSGEQDRCKDLPGKNSSDMISFLYSVRSPEESRMYAIVDKDGPCKSAGGVGTMYVEAVAGSGGTAASICNDYDATNGYGNYLKAVSTDVKRILKKQFVLSSTPDMARFEIAVDGTVVTSTGALIVKGNVVTIDQNYIKDGQKISFSYTHDAIPMFTEVPVSVTPSLDTLKVSVNGTSLVSGRDFTYDGVKRVIVFKNMPPEDAKVVVTYLEDKKLLTHFGVDLAGVRPDTLKVNVNAVAADTANYSYDSAGVDFTAPPADGSVVSIFWKTDDHKILKYAASISDARHPTAWTIKDKATGADVVAEWDRKQIVFAPDQVIENRVVTVEVDFGEKSAMRTVDLPNNRIDDPVKIKADGQEGVCTAAAGLASDQDPSPPGKDDKSWKARYKGKQVTLKCREGADYGEITVDYKHEVSRINDFLVKLPTGVDPNDPMLGWKVFIDGKPTKEFKRDGAEIQLEEDLLPPETRVDVEVTTYSRYEK
jgi:hypothetical protein